jgi:flagellar hook-associated protein 1
MTVSSFLGLQTALRGILAHQAAIDTAGHNIANADTKGYSRQEATLSPSLALTLSGTTQLGVTAELGTGVDVQSYRRLRNTFLDVQYRAQAMQLSYQDATSNALDQVELSLGEPGDNGLQSQLAKLWSAWDDVANAPSADASRQALVDQAASVAGIFNRLDAQLTTVSSQSSSEYASIIGPQGEVAGIAKEIGQLNDSISHFVALGDTPNDLMDRRDLLLDRLSQLSQVSVTDLGDGTIKVGFSNVTLVNGTTVNWPDATFATTTGQLGALQQVFGAGGTVESYRTALNAAAKQLADSVNALHNPGGTGTDFFSATAGTEAATLKVAVGPSGVVASSTGAPGSNDIALAIAGLRRGAPDAAYSTFVSRVANDVKDASRQSANAQALVDAIDDRRQSVSGVSLDEEMTNMVRFQRGFQAASRTLSTMDDMLDTLINRTGRVGL